MLKSRAILLALCVMLYAGSRTFVLRIMFRDFSQAVCVV
jgi:hypothetical protein